MSAKSPTGVGRVALAALALALTLASAPASAASPVDSVDRAAACLRRGDAACAQREATRALEAAPEAALRREALALRAEAAALLDHPADAAADFSELLTLWAGFRLPPDRDPRVVAAFEDARRAHQHERLPTVLERGPLPAPPAPPLESLLGEPLLYAPAALLSSTEHHHERDFRLSLGAGVGLPLGAASDRYTPGIAATIEVGYALTPELDLWGEILISLLPVKSSLPIEPGLPGGLTAVSGVLGVMLSLPVATDVELVAAAGVGAGGFGLGNVSDAVGVAFHGVVGARYVLAPQLAFRLDAIGQLISPSAADIGAGGHITLVLRGETTF